MREAIVFSLMIFVSGAAFADQYLCEVKKSTGFIFNESSIPYNTSWQGDPLRVPVASPRPWPIFDIESQWANKTDRRFITRRTWRGLSPPARTIDQPSADWMP